MNDYSKHKKDVARSGGVHMSKPVRDHNHATGLARELLCDPCNRMLGAARDNEQTLRAAASYVQKHRTLSPFVLKQEPDAYVKAA